MSEPTPTGRSVPPLGPEVWELLRRYDPDFHRAARAHVEVVRRSSHLEPKVKAFVGLVVDAAVTHLHGPGIRQHLTEALAAGATQDELMEVLECATTVSIHALNHGLPILLDVMRERGERTGAAPLDDRRQRLKDDFTARRGYWNSTWDELLEVAPDFFATYTQLSSVPWDHGHLPPVVKELLYIAFDASVTHLYGVGLRLHIENALALGATPEQVVEVMQIASLIGLRAAGEGVTALAEATDHREGH